jgi:hypothetical protein
MYTFEWEISFSDVCLCGDLMGIHTIAQGELFLCRSILLSEKIRNSEIVIGRLEKCLNKSYLEGLTLRANMFLVSWLMSPRWNSSRNVG